MELITVVEGTAIRRADPNAVFIKPDRLDEDGEFTLNIADLCECLTALGYNVTYGAPIRMR